MCKFRPDDLAKRAREMVEPRPVYMRGYDDELILAMADEIEQLRKAIRAAIDCLDHMESDAAEVILLNVFDGRE